MPKLIFHSLIALMLVVSCECKDMHMRRMPEEKDIAFKGEVTADPSKKTKTYVPNEQREIQVRLTSSDEEAKEGKFKILSATLADGSPADLDYTSLKLGNNTLHYTPKKPGTHELTIKVAIEGEGNVQTIHCTLEAPAAEWKAIGRANREGQITLTIENAPEEWRGESWRIQSTRWSRGLQERITGNITQLQAGENTLPITLQGISLAEPPQVHFTLQGPDGTSQSITLSLRAMCVARLEETYSEEYIQRLNTLNTDVRQQAAAYQGNLTGNDRAEAQRTLRRLLDQTTHRQAEANERLERLQDDISILLLKYSVDLTVLNNRSVALRHVLETLNDSVRILQPMVGQLNASNTGPIDPYHVLREALQQGTYDAESMAEQLASPLLSRDVINKRDPSGHTLLHYATEAENQEAISLLLDEGAVQDLISDWQLQGDYEAAGQQLVLTIGDTPGRIQQARGEQAQWRITSTTWSEGLEGRIAPNLALQHGENRIPLTIDMGTLTEAPSVQVVLQGPERTFQSITLDLREVCMARLRAKENDLAGQTERVNAYVQETDTTYQLPPKTVTDPRANRESQDAVGVLLGRLEAFQTQYERDLEAFSSSLETLEQTQVNENRVVFEANNKRLKDAIASLKSAQVQLQQQCTTAHEALLTIKDENKQAIETLLNDPNLNVDHVDGKKTLLQKAIKSRYQYTVKRLLEKGANANLASPDGESPLQTALKTGNGIAIDILLEHKADLNKRYEFYLDFNCNALQAVLVEYAQGGFNDDYLQFFFNQIKNFLEKGASVNARSSQGETALHYGVRTWNIEIVNALLNAGADVNATNNDGMTVLDTFIEDLDTNPYRDTPPDNPSELMRIIKILREHGAYCANKEGIIENTDFSKKGIDLLERGIWGSPYE